MDLQASLGFEAKSQSEVLPWLQQLEIKLFHNLKKNTRICLINDNCASQTWVQFLIKKKIMTETLVMLVKPSFMCIYLCANISRGSTEKDMLVPQCHEKRNIYQ